MTLAPGVKFGPCEIGAPPGAGGTDEVYRTLFDVGRQGDTDDLVMEPVEGETPADRLA